MSTEKKPFVIMHKDGNWVNNDATNLEWLKAPIPVSEGNCYVDGRRSKIAIQKYMQEALDKAWFSRTHSSDNQEIDHVRKENVRRILSTYPDIPESGYGVWEDGYWNGILSALRWVLGEEKDFIDT